MRQFFNGKRRKQKNLPSADIFAVNNQILYVKYACIIIAIYHIIMYICKLYID